MTITNNQYSYADGLTAGNVVQSSSSLSELSDLAISFGVGYLFAQKDKREAEALMRRIQALQDAQKIELLNKTTAVLSELAKTEVIYSYLAEQEQKQRVADIKKKRIVPIIGIGIGIILLTIIVIKLKK